MSSHRLPAGLAVPERGRRLHSRPSGHFSLHLPDHQGSCIPLLPPNRFPGHWGFLCCELLVQTLCPGAYQAVCFVGKCSWRFALLAARPWGSTHTLLASVSACGTDRRGIPCTLRWVFRQLARGTVSSPKSLLADLRLPPVFPPRLAIL